MVAVHRELPMEPWLTRLVPFVRVAALVAVGFGALVFLVQRWIAFPGAFATVPRSNPEPPDGAEQLWVETELGLVEAWLFPAPGPGPHPALLYAHGNGELIDHWVTEMRDLARGGVTAVAVEFPGYGFSDGKPRRATIRQTFREAFDKVADRPDVDRDRIVAYGRSMGGGAAGDLALDRPVSALVLQSTFSSTMDVARSMLVPGFLVRDRFDNRRAVVDFGGPVLVMHGPADDVIPYRHAEGLAVAREGLEVVDLDCAHNDCGSEWPFILSTLTEFMTEHGLFGQGTVSE